MKLAFGFVTGTILTLIAATYLTPNQTVYETRIVKDTITITEPTNLEDTLQNLRDVTQATQHTDEQLLAECLYTIVDRTEEPMAGIVYYIERYWKGDSCAALDHLLTHDWY
jgi:hypothetical protein